MLSSVADERTGGAGSASIQAVNGIAARGGCFQDITHNLGDWIRFGAWGKNVSVAWITELSTSGFSAIASCGSSSASWALGNATARTTTTNCKIRLSPNAATINATARFDDVSAKIITLPTTLATITSPTPTQTAAAKIHTLTTGTQAGVVSLLDSASNPKNFLIGYHDGTNVKLDKCVAGTYTSLISTAVSFSSNAQIEIRRPSGNTFQLWYNGSQRGTDQTVSDASIISNTIYGMFSTYEGNLFTEFTLDGAVIPFLFPAPAPTFAPTLLAGLWAWYDASDISSLYQDSGRTTPVVTDGDPVGAASDKSGSARHMLQAGASTLKPTYTTNVQNGLASLSFDGGDYLDLVGTPSTSAVTILGAARTSATVNVQRGLVATRSSTAAGVRVFILTGNGMSTNIYDGTTSTSNNDATAIAATTPFAFGMRVTSAGALDLIRNGVITTDTHALTMAHQAVSLGRSTTNQTTNLLNGHLLEVIMYNRALTNDEITQVSTYLNTKWAVY